MKTNYIGTSPTQDAPRHKMFVAQDTAVEPGYKFIKAEDETEYAAWTTPHLHAFCPAEPPPLYHYATGSTLIEMIRSGEMWSTQLGCLNDASELVHPIELLHAKAKEHLAASTAPEVTTLLEHIVTGLAGSSILTEGRFVACFSEDGDDLSQWRGYTGGEGGYALEFDSNHLRKGLLPAQYTVLGKVEYDPQKHDAFMEDVMQTVTRFFVDGLHQNRAPSIEAWLGEFIPYWANLLMMFAPFIKHPKFKGEREWRLVHHLQDEAIPRMRYLQRSSMMTRHVPMRLMMRGDQPCLPLKGIVVGPSRHKEVSKISVADLLRTHGYSNEAVPVTTTEIPYRTV
jgi:hypothetical protein